MGMNLRFKNNGLILLVMLRIGLIFLGEEVLITGIIGYT